MSDANRSWYSIDSNNELNIESLLSLYDTYYSSLDVTLTHYHTIRNYYVIMLTALFGIFFSLLAVPNALTNYYVFFHVILIAIIILAVIAYNSTNRYYRVWLERIIMISKIENMLGLDDSIKTTKEAPEKILWERDLFFMLNRYVEDRYSFNSSQDFLDNRMKTGDNKWSRYTFLLFIFLSILSLIGILLKYPC